MFHLSNFSPIFFCWLPKKGHHLVPISMVAGYEAGRLDVSRLWQPQLCSASEWRWWELQDHSDILVKVSGHILDGFSMV